jgi:hypothetical protein
MAATATALLLPHIKKGGEKPAETLGEKLPAGIAMVWKEVTSRFKGKPAAEEAVKDLVARADDPDCQAAFRKELRKLLEADAQFFCQLERLLATASADPINNDGPGAVATHGGVAAGEAGVAVGGDVHGDINVGSRISGDYVRGDKVLGDKIHRQINTGGGTCLSGDANIDSGNSLRRDRRKLTRRPRRKIE